MDDDHWGVDRIRTMAGRIPQPTMNGPDGHTATRGDMQCLVPHIATKQINWCLNWKTITYKDVTYYIYPNLNH